MSRTHCGYATDPVQHTAPCSTQCRHTRLMLPHNHNGSLTFLVNLNSVTSTRKWKTPWGWSHRRSKHVGVF